MKFLTKKCLLVQSNWNESILISILAPCAPYWNPWHNSRSMDDFILCIDNNSIYKIWYLCFIFILEKRKTIQRIDIFSKYLSYSIELPIFNLQELSAVNLKRYPSAFIRFWQQGLIYCPTQEKWTNPFVLTKGFSFWQIHVLLKYNQTQSRSGPKEIGIGVNMGITHSPHRLFLLKSVFFSDFWPKKIPSNRGVITCSNV